MIEIKTLQEWIEWAEEIENSVDSSDDSQYEKELVAIDDGKKQGILEACEEIHKFCLKEGMDCEAPEQRAYTRMIVFLNSKFGELRKQNS